MEVAFTSTLEGWVEFALRQTGGGMAFRSCLGLPRASGLQAHSVSLSDPACSPPPGMFPPDLLFHRGAKTIMIEVECMAPLFFSRPALNLQGKNSRHLLQGNGYSYHFSTNTMNFEIDLYFGGLKKMFLKHSNDLVIY